jgi:hypothetical protein
MELTDLGQQEGWYWQRGDLEISLAETSTGRVRGTRRWTVKSSATNRESSVMRAMNQTDAILKKELRTAVIDMVNSH